MFRYDRPQAGRYRQFHQFGVEAIGEGDAAVDLDVLQLAMDTMHSLGLGGMTLVLNNIGDAADRPRYVEALREHFRPHAAHMGKDDQRRLDTNPLRLLDSKELAGQSFMDDAPRSTDFLGDEAQAHWDELLSYLDSLAIPYRLDHKLVRGLDYYTRTVFEVHPAAAGAQSAVCAGGRYDGLIEQLGGKPTPGIGFAAGIERLMLSLRDQEIGIPDTQSHPSVIAFRGAAAKARAVGLATELRAAGLTVVLAPDRSLKAQMRFASSTEASQVLILGDQELERGVVTMRDMTTAEQREVPQADAAKALEQTLASRGQLPG
jgi:histidyl-tRNA synthetase